MMDVGMMLCGKKGRTSCGRDVGEKTSGKFLTQEASLEYNADLVRGNNWYGKEIVNMRNMVGIKR